MGVFEERPHTPGMHWQQHEQYIGPAYDPSRDLSPNLPSCDSSSMGDVDPSVTSSSGGSSCSTPSNNNHQSCGSEICRPPPSNTTTSSGGPGQVQCQGQGQHPPTSQSQHHPAGPQDLRGGVSHPASFVEHHIPKLEPMPGTPPTPPSSTSCAEDSGCGGGGTGGGGRTHGGGGGGVSAAAGAGAICAGCALRITDRYYLQAVDRRWHATCLQCCQCRNALDGEITCFSREGNIYCKKDYYRLFGMKRCARCQATIIASELVMRARDLVFHVRCFSCAVCSSPLTKGDHFGMREGVVLCRLHFEMPPLGPGSDGPGMPPGMFPPGGGMPYPPPFPSPEFLHHHHHHQQMTTATGAPSSAGATTTPVVEPVGGKVPFFNGAPTTPRQKGRPRKRKPKDLEAMTANLDLNSDYLDMSFGRSPGTPGMHGSNQRTKRMRTSFKHHQLRTMKSYFAINHNPDAKDLKQLSQKTGLPKRVLQVWFQNARAKWRRMMLKQEGKSGDKCSGSESMSDLDLYPHGPGSMASSIQSMAPHSPPFILPPGSPSSLDCS